MTLAWEELVPGLGDGVDPGATRKDREQGVRNMLSSPSDLLGLRLAGGNIS